MLATIREYAAERLEEEEEATAVVTASAQHLTSTMAGLAERVETEESGAWVGEFEAEAANLVHLAGEAIAHGATVEALRAVRCGSNGVARCRPAARRRQPA